MYTPTPELEKLRREKEAAEKKIEQYKHHIQRLENRKKYYEDGERAKGLLPATRKRVSFRVH